MANFSIELSDEDEARFRAAFAGYDLDEAVTRILQHAFDCKIKTPQNEADEQRRRDLIMSGVRRTP